MKYLFGRHLVWCIVWLYSRFYLLVLINALGRVRSCPLWPSRCRYEAQRAVRLSHTTQSITINRQAVVRGVCLRRTGRDKHRRDGDRKSNNRGEPRTAAWYER